MIQPNPTHHMCWKMRPNPTQPMDGPNSCPSLSFPITLHSYPWTSWPTVPVFPGQSRFGTLCPGIPNVVFGTPKCPGLAPDVPGGTELNPHNQLSLSVWRFLKFLRWFCDLCWIWSLVIFAKGTVIVKCACSAGLWYENECNKIYTTTHVLQAGAYCINLEFQGMLWRQFGFMSRFGVPK